MFKSNFMLIAIDSLVFYLTAMVAVIFTSALFGLFLAIGIHIIAFSKSSTGEIIGIISMITVPLTTAFIAILFCAIPSAISAVLFGFSVFIIRKVHLPKILLLLTSMGASYIGAKYGFPTNDLWYISPLSVIAGLVVSSIVCYSKPTKQHFSYP